MYQNNHFQNKPIIKFLFVLYFFLNCPAFSENISTNFSMPNSETGDLTVSKQGRAQAKRESTLHSVWKISNSSYKQGTAFAVGPNQMITNFHVLSGQLEKGGSLEDIVLTQSVSSSQLQIQRLLKVSAYYDIVLFETKETVSNYLELEDDLLDPEEELSVIGYPKGVLTTIQKTGNLFQEDKSSFFSVNPMDHRGASGSPVLNTQSEVVGAAFFGTYNSLWFIKAIYIQELLSRKESPLCSPFLLSVKCFEQERPNFTQMSEEGSTFAQYMLGQCCGLLSR